MILRALAQMTGRSGEVEEADFTWLGSQILNLGLDTLHLPSSGDVQQTGRLTDRALEKEVWAVHISLGVNSVYMLIISEAGEGSKGNEIVQGEYGEQKKRTKRGACGTLAFRVDMFQQSGKLLPKRRTVKDH